VPHNQRTAQSGTARKTTNANAGWWWLAHLLTDVQQLLSTIWQSSPKLIEQLHIPLQLACWLEAFEGD
jgi:hypothetical protein